MRFSYLLASAIAMGEKNFQSSHRNAQKTQKDFQFPISDCQFKPQISPPSAFLRKQDEGGFAALRGFFCRREYLFLIDEC
jgi:hypothetical protein